MMYPGISLIGEPEFISFATAWPSLPVNMLHVTVYSKRAYKFQCFF